LPWMFFATAIAAAGNSVVGSEGLITKIYFPRLAIPLAAVGAAVVDFAIAFSLLIALMIYYGIAPGAGLLFVPLVFVLIVLFALGVGTLLAALNVAYRDFRYVIPFLVQLWMFATPTVYMQPGEPAPTHHPAAASAHLRDGETGTPVAQGLSGPAGKDSAAPGQRPRTREYSYRNPSERVRAVMTLNPMTALVATFRASILKGSISWGQLAIASSLVAVVFLFGCFYFRKVEGSFADII
jgi:homopolymeric O-antigen transport system permease protein